MAHRLSQPDHVNVLIGNADWPWPQAVAEIFRPRGINALVANSPDEMVHIIDNSRIHLAILDENFGKLTGLQAMKMIQRAVMLQVAVSSTLEVLLLGSFHHLLLR